MARTNVNQNFTKVMEMFQIFIRSEFVWIKPRRRKTSTPRRDICRNVNEPSKNSA